MDILSDISLDRRIETFSFGVFKFQLGVNWPEIASLFPRVEDAQLRFKASPLSHVAHLLEKEVVVSSVFGTIYHLHNRVNRLTHVVLYEANLKRLHYEKVINDRQYAILNAVLHNGTGLYLSHLKKEPWYLALYSKLTDKTKSSDLSKLKGLKLIVLDKSGLLAPGFVEEN